MAKANTPATVDPGGLATPMQVPDYLKGYGAVGSENVRQEDKVLARIVLLQALSPEVERGNAKFIESARAGDIMHNVLGTLHQQLLFVDAYFRLEYGVFRKRTKGGGFRGVVYTEAEANALLAKQEDKDDCEIVQQAAHYGIALDPDTKESLGPVALVLTSTKMKVSRKLNSLIDAALSEKGLPRFAGTWKLTVVAEKNEKGSFYNFAVAPSGWTPQPLAEAAFKVYNEVKSGLAKAGFEEPEAPVEGAAPAPRNLSAEI
jgi:hypothetical protein